MGDDGELIDAALAGDSAAFGRLVTKYQDRLYGSVAHLVGAADEASDVVQDALVQAYVKLDTFQRSSAFYTWLYRIAFNLAITRKRRRRPTASLDNLRETSGSEPVAGVAGPGDRMEQQERVCQVRAALARLQEEHRSVLVLREIDGCDYETIAEILEVPLGTVRSRLHRARLELRQQLKDALQEDLK